MAYYRLYLLHGNGRIGSVVDFHCASDEEAIANAGSHGPGQGMELWNQDRRVRVFPRAATPAPAEFADEARRAG